MRSDRPKHPANPRRRFLTTSALAGLAALTLLPSGARANPAGGSVVAGQATISTSGKTVTIGETSNRAVIDWKSFSIAGGETTQFHQPSSNSVVMNQVTTPNDPSVIAGALKANGDIIIINASGVTFANGAEVDVNALVATTAGVSAASQAAFMAGGGTVNFDVAGKPNATVVNQAGSTIKVGSDTGRSVAQHGLAALVAPGVRNDGVIQAKLGKVALAGANTFTVDLYGDGLISFDATSLVKQLPAGQAALVTNNGTVSADGGTVLLTADAVDSLVTNLVDTAGVVRARTAAGQTGTVDITAVGSGSVNVEKTVDVSGLAAGQTGGNVAITGQHVTLAGTARIDARGADGGGTVKIGGGLHGQDATIANAATTTVAKGASVDASATRTGNGGAVTVWSDQGTAFAGRIKARGGEAGGNGGFVEVSGENLLYLGRVNTLAPSGLTGTLLLDPANVTISTAKSSNENFAGGIFSPKSGVATSNVNNGDLEKQLAGTNITVTTTNTGKAGNAQGNITVTAPIAWSAKTTLTLLANTNITVSNTITATGAGSGLVLNAVKGGISITDAISVGSLTAAAGGAAGISITNAVTTTAGAALTADAISITGAKGALNAAGQTVTLAPSNKALAVSVGGTTDPGNDLFLSKTTLNGISAGTLVIGDVADTGRLTITGALAQAVPPDALSHVGNLTLAAGSGGIAIDNPITLAFQRLLTVETTGSAAQTSGGAVSTQLLLLTGGGSFTLDDKTNAVSFLAGSVGTLSLTDSSSLAIQPTGGVNNLTAAGNVTLTSDSIQTTGAGGQILAGTNVVFLQPLTTSLPVNVGGTTDPSPGADFFLGTPTLNGVTAGSLVIGNAADTGALTVTSMLAAAAGTDALFNVTNLALVSGSGGIAIENPVSPASTGVLILDTSGKATQSAAIAVSGAKSGLLLLGAGDFILENAANSITSLAGNVKTLSLFDNAPLTVGTVLGVSNLAATGDVALVSNGTLTLESSIGGADLLLETTAGDIVEPQPPNAGGIITAKNAALNSAGLIDLQQANTAATIAATATGGIAYTAAGALTVGSVTVTVQSGGPVTLAGLTATGSGSATPDTALVAGGTLTIAKDINVGQNKLLLDTTSGDVTETGGVITATGLAIDSAGLIDLQSANLVGVLAATARGGGIAFSNGQGLTVGSMTTVAPSDNGATPITGVTATATGSATPDTALVAAGTLSIVGNIDVGANKLLLVTTNGDVFQMGATITAAALAIDSAGLVDLQSGNRVGTLAAIARSGGIAFTDNQALTVGSVTTKAPSDNGANPITGVTAAATGSDVPDTALVTAGTLTIVANVNVGTNNVLLNTTSGDVVENGGIVAASGLAIDSAGQIDLQGANLVGTLAAIARGGGITFDNAQGLTVGSVTTLAPSDNGATPIAGITATSTGSGTPDTALVAAGPLTLASAVDVGANSVLFISTISTVTLSGGVTAAGLGIEAVGATSVAGSFSHVGAIVTNGGFAYSGTKGFTTGVSIASPSLDASLGITATAPGSGNNPTPDTSLAVAGTIVVAADVNVGGNNLLLNTTAGDVTQTGGVITAAGLAIDAAGQIDLQGANLVGTLAAIARTGGITFQNAQTLVIGSITTNAPAGNEAIVGITATATGSATPDTAITATGALTVNGAIDVGANNLLLVSSSAGVTLAAGVTAAGFGVEAVGDTTVTGGFGRIGAIITNGGFAYSGTAGVTVGVSVVSPSLSASFGITATGPGSGANPNPDTALVVNGSIALATDVNVGGNKLLLNTTGGDVTEAGGIVTASELAVDSFGLIDLQDANQVGTLAAIARGGGIAFSNSQALTIGSVATNAPAGNAATPLSGITATATGSAAPDTALVIAGTLTIAASINVGPNNILLNTTSGDVTATGGAISAAGLAIDSAGMIDLQGTNLVGTLAAIARAGGIAFSNAQALAIGSVATAAPSNNGAAPVTGITATATGSATPDTALVTAGTLTIVSNISVGANKLQLDMTGGDVIENGGVITASQLAIDSAGLIDLQSANQVGTLAAIARGGGIAFSNAQALGIGSVTTNAPSNNGAAPVTGINATATGSATPDTALVTAGTLTIVSNVDAGANNLLLNTTSGDVVENGGTVTAAGLAIDSAGLIDLQSANQVGTLAASARGGGIAFSNAQALTIGSITTGAPSDNAAITGITATATGSATPDTALVIGGTLTISSNVTVGTNNLLLNTTSGDVIENGGATTAAGLAVDSAGLIDLQGANQVGTLAAIARAGGIAFSNARALTIDSVTTVAPSDNGANPVTGITAAATGSATPDTALVAGGTLTIVGNVAVGANNLLLSTTSGDVVESSGIVTASRLAIDAAGQIDLQGANLVGTLAAIARGGGIAFSNAQALVIGSVATAAPSDNSAINGITATATGSATPDTALVVAGTLTIVGNVTVGTNDLLLNTTSGDVMENGGLVTASGLAVDSAGLIELQGANQVGTLAAIGRAGGIAFGNARALIVGSVAISAPSGIGAVAGITATTTISATPDTALVTAGTLTIVGNISVGTNKLLLNTTSGDVVGSGGIITASQLAVDSAGLVDLQGANQVSTLAAIARGGGIAFSNAQALTIGTVTTAAPSDNGATPLSGVTATATGSATPDTALVAAGTLTIVGSATVGGNNLLLDTTSGDVVENGGIVAASGLAVDSAGLIDLQGANLAGTFAAIARGGGIAFSNAQALTVGSVMTVAPSDNGAVGGITATAAGSATPDTALVAAGTLTIVNNVSIGANKLLLNTTSGDVIESGGLVTSVQLAIDSAGLISLQGANQVGTLAAIARGGGIAFSNAQTLTIGGVSTNAPSDNGAVTGLTATSTGSATPDTTLAVAGTLTIASNINAGTSNLLLSTASGDVVETGGVISVSQLAVDSAGLIDLQGANQVGTLAAIARGGGIAFGNAQALTIGSVTTTAPSDNGAVTGITATATGSATPDTALVTAGMLTIANNISVGANKLLLNTTSGDVVETGGSVTASGLAIDSAGLIDLQSANQVGMLAAIARAGGIAFSNAQALTVGSAATNAPSDNGAVTGVTATATGSATPDTALVSVGTLTLVGNVNVGANKLLLNTTNGNVVETGGVITASQLAIDSAGLVDLQSANLVGALAAVARAGGIAFSNAQALTIGSITTNAPSNNGVTPVVGVTAAATGSTTPDTALVIAGTLTIASNVSVGANNLLLSTTSGDVTENGGKIFAAGLAVASAGLIDLQSTNQVNTLAAAARGGGIAFSNAQALAIGSITANAPSDNGATPLGGITATATGSATPDTALVTNGTLTILGNIDVGANKLQLSTTSGDIIENGGTVTAAGLAADSAGMIDLRGANLVGTLAADAHAGGIAFTDNQTLAISSVFTSAPSDNRAPPIIGITAMSTGSATPDTAIVAAGTLTVVSNIDVGANKLLLNTTSGDVVETTGMITASELAIDSAGLVNLLNPNQVGTFAAIARGGGIAFNDNQAVIVGSVTTNAPSDNGATPVAGITATATGSATPDTALAATGTLTIVSNINVGANKLLLNTTSGDVIETGGLITASQLAIDSAGMIDLQSANQVGTLAAVGRAGGIAFADNQALTIGSVSTGAPSLNGATPVTGVTATATGSGTPDTAIVASGALTIATNIDAGANKLLLKTTGGDITETGGQITAAQLAVDSGGQADLESTGNLIGTLAAIATGRFVLYDAQSLNITSVTTAAPSDNEAAATSGIKAGGGLFIYAAGTMTVTGVNLSAGPGGNIGLGARHFIQTGTSTFSAHAILIDTSGLRLGQILAFTAPNATQGINALPPAAAGPRSSAPVITLGVLNAQNSILLLSTTSGTISGEIHVKELGVRGLFGVSNLTGSIGGINGLAAAQVAVRAGGADSNYRFNTCVINSPTCILLPLLVPVLPEDVNTFELLQSAGQFDDLDIERVDTGNEDQLDIERVGTGKGEEQ